MIEIHPQGVLGVHSIGLAIAAVLGGDRIRSIPTPVWLTSSACLASLGCRARLQQQC